MTDTDTRVPHPDCTIAGAHKRHRWYDHEFGLEEIRCPGRSFEPGYDTVEDTRIHRQRLVPDEGGVATARFRGTTTGEVWIERGSSGRLSVFTEVTASDTAETLMRVAVVPTGKRVPAGRRIGSGGGLHAYLLGTETRAVDAATDAVDLDAFTPADGDHTPAA